MRLTVKTGLTIVAILMFAISVTSLLNYYKYQSTLSELVRSRLVVIGIDLKHTIEGSVGLGIALSQTDNVEEIIGRSKQGDEYILSVEVYETTANGGVRLFHTEKTGIGEPVSETWIEAAKSAKKHVWTADDKLALTTGFSLVNNFDKVIGAIVFRYSRTYQQGKIDAMFEKLARTSGLVLAIVSALAFFGVFIFFRKISSSFERMTDSLNALIAGKEPTLTEENALTDEEIHFSRFQKKIRSLLGVMAEAQDNAPPPGGKG